MTRWDYEVVNPGKVGLLEQTLKELGEKEWEVSVDLTRENSEGLIILKREKYAPNLSESNGDV